MSQPIIKSVNQPKTRRETTDVIHVVRHGYSLYSKKDGVLTPLTPESIKQIFGSENNTKVIAKGVSKAQIDSWALLAEKKGKKVYVKEENPTMQKGIHLGKRPVKCYQLDIKNGNNNRVVNKINVASQ